MHSVLEPPPVLPHDPALDARFMRDALALGARHLGLTWPNPSVGAVIVRQSASGPVIVGRGVTQPGGRPHGEPMAIAMAGEAARGATLYVGLEPCSHFGRTPPCADAIIAAGLARVVSAIEDPDARVAGRGHARLREAGIAVDVGVLADEARRSHRGHIMRVTRRRPAVTVKLARTADGYAARLSGERLLITGAAANARVHLMRAHADAILVGVGTVLADDPQLTVRLPGLEHRSPVRVVLDSALRTPLTARLVATAREVPTWIVAAETAPVDAERALVAAGVEVMRVGLGDDGRPHLRAALEVLAERGMTRIFCEGGPALAEALTEADLTDDVVLVTGSVPLGAMGVPAPGPVLSLALADARRFLPATRFLAENDLFQCFERVF
ncbi:bifunctional diaminohydroxyphosphoribosylaminopyrimidine deaminase/5-amino-6-(5-phosphoribosylamino)uracil reductase RibD [Chelatococcus sp. SYSU_G07232]|uniref:Riboflavin biosynthesis protein RibD n=1 Tax=Chelatococcus albus TaxID=3047466 RepID=A0ABT7AC47_9HYPH|nr:bifunctional diaminohydroxyphosphoribosylaminopyrimidine deaminase/5-amino-6-(5-phosphoribosylamino)uracil reductase RibD [Chelatococcus sp. SYSU_G07232]MDJ1156934.1 bifunctional diaminohydroxyphosphoribosylaminopyrimidine deaminase/5-amino-6-(5-phosphoribosylamino)uracil reductase RibD [Chelatococcus sp. SYSU_G07232]